MNKRSQGRSSVEISTSTTKQQRKLLALAINFKETVNGILKTGFVMRIETNEILMQIVRINIAFKTPMFRGYE